MKRYLLIGPAIFILLWWLVCVLKIVDSFFLPDPISVVGKLFQLVFSGIILGDIGATLGRVMIAFAVAIILGWPAGLVLGMSKNVYKSCEFLIDFFRSTPATALFPLFLLVFGISDISKIAAATFAGLLIIIFNTAHGVMHSNHSRILAAEIMGASRFQIFKSILFWESLPQAIIGFRTAVSWSLAVLIVTEMFIGTNIGIGHKIIDFQYTYEVVSMYAVILLTGLIGYILNLLFVVIEKRFVHWTGK